MWKAIVSFFKAIDNGLIAIEDYFDYRVRTGKWVGDVKYISQDTKKNSNVLIHRARRSRPLRIFFLFIIHIWNQMLRVHAIEKGADLIVDAFSISKRIFIELIIILQLSFLSTIILYNLFINAPLLFFITLFPVLLFNSLIFSMLYYIVREGKKETRLPMKEALRLSLQVFTSLSTLIVIYVISSLVLIAAFFIIATSYSYLFTSIRISWENAFGFWVFIAPLFFLLLAILFGLSIVASQAYFTLLFEGKNIFYSFRKGTAILKTHHTWFAFFYLFYALTFAHIGYWISLIFFPLGFIASVFFFIQLFIFLSFLLRREFAHKEILISERVSSENNMLLSFFMFFGFATYAAVTVLSITHHADILEFMQQTQKRFIVSQKLTSYTNSRYGYTMNYPQGWSIHEEKDQSVTIYDNKTKTNIGAIFINIKALPFSELDFNRLYEARSGLTSYHTLDKDIAIKINNLTVDYQYPAVQYTYLKSGEPYNEYSMNYLIHKDDLMYVVSFITYDKEIQGENAELFEIMINSFKFEY